MKSVFILAAATVAALGVLVALPVAFVVLQAVFPRLAEGSLGDPFGAWGAVLSQPGTLALVGGTLKLGLSVAAVSAAIGIPLGALRGCSACRWRGCGTCCSSSPSCCHRISRRCPGPWRCNRAVSCNSWRAGTWVRCSSRPPAWRW